MTAPVLSPDIPLASPAPPAELAQADPADLPTCADIMYRAFRDIAERHGFPPDFPSAKVAEALLHEMLEAGFDAFVARQEGRAIGSIFLSRRSSVGGISVLTVDPETQNRSVGRRLMQHGIAFLAGHGHPRQQLVQAGYHNRSLSLYAKLGFVASEMLSVMAGPPIRPEASGRSVRPAREADREACDALCRRVLGFDRSGETARAIARGEAVVVEAGGRITGYATGVGFTGHGVGEGNEDVEALIASAEAFSGPGILIPTANGELFRWCLENGLRVVQQMILMDTAPSGRPRGGWWPSVLC